MNLQEHDQIVIISDVHLGSASCAFKTLLKLLESLSYILLIINGDLFDGTDPIPNEQFPVIDYLSKNHHRIIYVKGNHDPFKKGTIHHLLGIEVVKRHIIRLNGKKFCVTHGDQFDKGWHQHLFKSRIVDKTFVFLIKFLLRVNIFGYSLKGFIHRHHEKCAQKPERRAAKYAVRRRFGEIICGHNHLAKKREFRFTKGRRVQYVNCGSFVKEHPCSYVTINVKGESTVHYIPLGE